MGCLFVIVLGALSALLFHTFGYAEWLLVTLGVLWLASLVFSFLKGHMGFGGRGNTDAQIVIAGFGIAIALVLPPYAEQRHCGEARASLGELARAEAAYYAAHKRYSADLAALGLAAVPNVTVSVTRADDKAFVASASHAACGRQKDGTAATFTWDSSRGGLQ